MKKLLITLVALTVAASSANAQFAPQIPVESVPDFFRLPIGVNFGEVPAVAVNSQGHVFVYSRSNPTGGGPAYGIHAAQLFEFSPSGDFIREHGRGLYAWAFAHGLRIDANDNIWTVDKGSNMVIRMDPEGRVIWVFGRKAESSSEGARPIEPRNPPATPQDGRFREPTDVAFDSQGNIYISDGYINSRVAKYDMNGDWVMSWGEPGTGPGQLRTPHSIAIDRDDNVYVGDRSNARIQVFDADGNFQRMFSVATPIRPGSKAVNGTPRRTSQTWPGTARRTRSASHRGATSSTWARARSPGGSSKPRSRVRCSESSATPGECSVNFPECMASPAPRRTCCLLRRPQTHGCRS